MRKCFNWIKLRHCYQNKYASKESIVDIELYLFQELKAHHFMKLKIQNQILKHLLLLKKYELPCSLFFYFRFKHTLSKF